MQQEDCSIHDVLGRRNCGRRSLFWYVEQSVGRSEWIEDAGWQLLTSAHMSEGIVPTWSHVVQTLVDQNCCLERDLPSNRQPVKIA